MVEDLIELVRRDNTLINKETGEEAKVLKTYKSRVIITAAVSSKDFFGEFDEENFLNKTRKLLPKNANAFERGEGDSYHGHRKDFLTPVVYHTIEEPLTE
jgi:hypothetical protein